MRHTILQLAGLLVLALGAWLSFGTGGVVMVIGLATVIGSLIVEAGTPPPPNPPTGGE
jgi:hypothetical protein